MTPRRPSSKREPVISLINIVFLILIFFMVTGTLTGQNTSGISFVQTADLECCTDPNALALTADGQVIGETGAPVDIKGHIAGLDGDAPTIRLLPDQSLPASDLLETVSALKRAGAGRIIIVTENAGS
ncbi:MAG: biopolymer transporter ExbD [Pseudomonadota bacterium]